MFYYSLADQLLTIAPRELIDAVWKYASYLNSPTNFIAEHPYNTNMRFGPECSPAWSGEDFGCSFVWFLSALYERQRAFIPISSEPGSTQPVLTEAGTVQIIAPASAGSQVIATPYSPTSQTAQVVTQPTYIPSAPAPDTGGLPTSYTPPPIYNAAAGATTSPNVQPATPAIPSAAPANSSWLLLAAIAGFVLLKKRKEQ